MTFAHAADIAQPKKGKTVDPPLSASPPTEYTSLPFFGTITWETRLLPWVEEGPYGGISGMAMVDHGGKIYLVGGFIPAGDETKDEESRRTSRWTWMFDPVTDAWTRLADAPMRREYTRGIVSEDALYLVGGGNQYKGQDPPYRVHGDCAVLDLAAEPPTWQTLPPLNVPRTHTAIGTVDGNLIVVGGNEYEWKEDGYSHQTIRGTTEVFDLTHPDRGWQRRASLPGARGWSASFVANEQLYVFGGITWNANNATLGLRETLHYNPQSNTWQTKTPPPIAVSGWEGALHAGRYGLLVGGVTRPEREPVTPMVWSDLVWAYDVEDDAWMRVEGKLPPGAVFNDPGVVVLGDTIYVIGAEGPHGSHYNYFLVGKISKQRP
jgi:hypothetical protein